MNQETRKLIAEYSPMLTNKDMSLFEHAHPTLTFDIAYAKPNNFKSWNSKLAHPDSDIRSVMVRTFDDFIEGYELWIASTGQGRLDPNYIPYIMSIMADIMIDEEICLNYRIENNCLVVTIDKEADVIDCKEFFEEFYHLATGYNFDIDTGIPEDETEAEIYLTRLQDDFDQRMFDKLGDRYTPGNINPDELHAEKIHRED